MEFTSREIESATGRSPSGLRALADALPIAPASRGKARIFTVRDAVVIYASLEIEARGFGPQAARALVSAISLEIERLIADDAHRAWAIVWPEVTAEAGIGFLVSHDRSGGLDIVLAKGPDVISIIDIRSIVGRALTRVLAVAREAQSHA